MAKTALVERTLPLDLPEPSAHPTGDLFDARSSYTLPLSQEVALTRCLGPYTEVDRKLWATLVAFAWDDLATKPIHEVNARDIARLFRELKGGENGSAWVMASARRLMASRFDWEDDEEEGSATLLTGLRIKKVSGAIYYQFSDLLLEKLLDNKQFSRLRLHFMIGLSGKYSVTLYMLFESAANLRKPVIELSIDELRKTLSIEDGKLARWVDLNRFAIEPALRQINDNAAAAGFTVEAEPLKHNRKIDRVRFIVTKSNMRLDDEKSIRERIMKATNVTGKHSDRPIKMPPYSVDKALEIIRKEGHGLDAQAILREFEASSAELDIKNIYGLLTGFVRKKRKEYLGAPSYGLND